MRYLRWSPPERIVSNRVEPESCRSRGCRARGRRQLRPYRWWSASRRQQSGALL